ALPFGDDEVVASGLERVAQSFLGRVPTLDRAAELFGARRELDDHIGKAHVLVNRIEQMYETLSLGLDLLLGAEDVRIVLRHLPDAQQTMQRTISLVPVTAAELGDAHRLAGIGLNAPV